jgi:hypothetical protein
MGIVASILRRRNFSHYGLVTGSITKLETKSLRGVPEPFGPVSRGKSEQTATLRALAAHDPKTRYRREVAVVAAGRTKE